VNIKLIVILIVLIRLLSLKSYAQENQFSANAIKAGLGIGIHEGKREDGIGVMMSLGYLKTLKNTRVRINPDFMTGTFSSRLMLHTRDQHYKLTSLGLNGYYDTLRYKGISLFVGTGLSLNYSRGLLGTGGGKNNSNTRSDYFYTLYYAANAHAGLRINPQNKRTACTFSPFNIQMGNNQHFLGMWKLDIEIKRRVKN
jgi:opacity protein-like surface antigen